MRRTLIAFLVVTAGCDSDGKKTQRDAAVLPDAAAADGASPQQDVALDLAPDRNADAAPDGAPDTSPDRMVDVGPDGPFITMAPAPGCFELAEPLATVSFKGGKTLALDVGFGSSAYHPPTARSSVFYTITDRGPNIGCDETEKVIGVAGLCGDGQDVHKVFAVPTFAPTIYRFELVAEGGRLRARVVEKTPLKDRDGEPITGLTNDLKVTDTEKGFSPEGTMLPFDVNGIDSEGLVRLADGTFWIADEYGPSLVHVGSDGRILERVVPVGMEVDLAMARYKVTGLLPAVFARRKLNRGAESLGLSPDGKFLYLAMQSPLANPDIDAHLMSRNDRLLKLSLKADGTIDKVEGEYVYRLDTPDKYGDLTAMTGDFIKEPLSFRGQADVKVSEILAVGTDDLVVLERITKVTKLFRVKLAGATNILGTSWDQKSTTPSLETTDMPAGVTAVTKTLVFDSQTATAPFGCKLPDKVEGVALLDADHVLLINDSDFSVAGEKTSVVILPIGKAVAGP